MRPQLRTRSRLRLGDGNRSPHSLWRRSSADPGSPQGDLLWTSGLQKYERINVCCFEVPCMWRFVTEAPGSSYTGVSDQCPRSGPAAAGAQLASCLGGWLGPSCTPSWDPRLAECPPCAQEGTQ